MCHGCGTKVMTRTWSTWFVAPRMPVDRQGALGDRLAHAQQHAVLDEHAQGGGVEPRLGAFVETLAGAQPRVELAGVDLLIARIPLDAGVRAGLRARRGGHDDPGEAITGRPVAVLDGGDQLDERVELAAAGVVERVLSMVRSIR